MCGIAGVVGMPTSAASARLEEALSRLTHRGPDGVGQFVGEGIVLGMRRLAVIDVSGGSQPIYNEDHTVAVVCNGELYNYCELMEGLRRRGHRLQSKSDVNVLPHLYEESGDRAVESVRGMFAAALWDNSRRRLVLWRDRVGKKPLFYSRVGAGLAFASELPALLALLPQTPAQDQASLGRFLQLGFIPHPDTVYRGVHALPPGHFLTWAEDGPEKVMRYWQRDMLEPFSGTRTDAVSEIGRRLDEAVLLRLRSDVPLGLFLSGGIDSALVASSAVRGGARDLQCFVVETDDPALNEAPSALRVAKYLGLKTEVIPLRYAPTDIVPKVATLYGQPFADSSAVPSYVIAQVARRHRKVVLTGDGGDEVFAGYRRYLLARVARWCGKRPGRAGWLAGRLGTWLGSVARRRSSVGFLARGLRGVGLYEAERYLAWTADLFGPGQVRRWFPELPSLPQPLGVGQLELACHGLRSMLRTDFELILPADLLMKMDIATMANGLEARSPLLDVPLVEFAWSLPDEWLVHGLTTKPLLRELAESRLPPEVARAPKQGFEVPVAHWLANELRPLLAETLLARDSRVAQFGSLITLTSLVSGRTPFAGNRPQAIWALLMLELFLRAPAPAPASA